MLGLYLIFHKSITDLICDLLNGHLLIFIYLKLESKLNDNNICENSQIKLFD